MGEKRGSTVFQVNYLNKISPKGTALWTENYQVSEKIEDADALLVRSAAMQDFTFSNKLLAVARAGAGVNNIPLDRCAEQGIVVFNTPGANARSVMELTLCGLLLGKGTVTACHQNDLVHQRTLRKCADAAMQHRLPAQIKAELIKTHARGGACRHQYRRYFLFQSLHLPDPYNKPYFIIAYNFSNCNR